MGRPFPECDTLVDLLHWRAQHTPATTGLIFQGDPYTFQWLWDNSRRYASRLMDSGAQRGERILLLVPNSPEFFIAFYGCLICGAVPVPLFADAGTNRSSRIAGLSGATHIILPSKTSTARKTEFEEWAESAKIRLHLVSEIKNSFESAPEYPVISAGDVGFIQYTSGSTGFPKGIPLTHENLLTNIRQMVHAMNITGEDVFVSWLPVFHDMGLILMTMVPFYTGAKLVLLPVGMHRIHSWLKAIGQYRGTFIAAPDTAYRLCVKATRQPGEYDLTSLRVALNASEPVHLSTYRMFEEAFNLKHVMVSGYGLAEATVAVTMHPPGFPPVTDEVGYVASGRPVDGVEIRIDSSIEMATDGRSGEILVRSPALMVGYEHPALAEGPINPEGFLHTGDAGYLDKAGNLFVLSRIKNIIIHAGHTLYPDDVEEVVRPIEGVRAVAALGIKNLRTGGENLSVFVELKSHQCTDPDKCHDLIIRIVNELHDAFGIRPAKVLLMKPKSIPRTPNGKLQYGKLKIWFTRDSGEFRKRVLYPQK